MFKKAAASVFVAFAIALSGCGLVSNGRKGDYIAVSVDDLTAPIIRVQSYQVKLGSDFKSNEIYKVSDNMTKKPKVVITGKVNTEKEGTYDLTITAIDDAGNKSVAKTTVKVVKDGETKATSKPQEVQAPDADANKADADHSTASAQQKQQNSTGNAGTSRNQSQAQAPAQNNAGHASAPSQPQKTPDQNTPNSTPTVNPTPVPTPNYSYDDDNDSYVADPTPTPVTYVSINFVMTGAPTSVTIYDNDTAIDSISWGDDGVYSEGEEIWQFAPMIEHSLIVRVPEGSTLTVAYSSNRSDYGVRLNTYTKASGSGNVNNDVLTNQFVIYNVSSADAGTIDLVFWNYGAGRYFEPWTVYGG